MEAAQENTYRGLMMRTFSKRVRFLNPFLLPGMVQPHPPGEFDVIVEEEPLDVMWEAYHRTLTFMLTSQGLTEAYRLNEESLDALICADRAIPANPNSPAPGH